MGEGRYHRISSVVFTLSLSFFAIFSFYFTPVGSEVEQRLYDLRTVLKPRVLAVEGVVYVEVDRPLGQDAQHVKTLVEVILAQQPKSISLVLSSRFSELDQTVLASLLDLCRRDSRVFLGVGGYDAPYPSGRGMPLGFRDESLRVFGIDTFVELPTDYIREVPYGSYRGVVRRNLLPAQLVGMSPGEYQVGDRFLLNYIDASSLMTVDSRSLLQTNDHSPVKGNHVFLDVAAPVTRRIPAALPGAKVLDQTWAQLAAGVTLNLIHDLNLKEDDSYLFVLQTIVVTLMFGGVWLLGITQAVALIVLGWLGLLYLHGLLFTEWQMFVRLADTALFSTISGTVGGLWRLSREGQLRVEQEERTQSQRDLSRIQTKFLENFSDGLSVINDNILRTILRHHTRFELNEKLSTVYLKLLGSCEELRDYLSGIKNFSQITSRKKAVVKKDVFPVAQMVDRVFHQFASICQDRGIRTEVICDVALEIYSAETILERILLNLISNAVKYSPDGGTVVVKVERGKRREVVLSVSDQGPGIPSEYYDLIFERFYRIQNESLHSIKGNGLGLHLCRFFAEKIGAKLSVTSEPGQGAVFWINVRGAIL